MTPYAIYFVAMLAPWAIVAVIAAIHRGRKGEIVGRGRGAVAGLSAAFLVCCGWLILGWALPDALDDLPADQQTSVGGALGSSPSCGMLPFARVLEVEVAENELSFTCGLTPFGWPRFSSEGQCAEGTWQVPGILGPTGSGNCGPTMRSSG